MGDKDLWATRNSRSSEIIARARGVDMQDVGTARIRPPIKPVTLAELAAMDEDDGGPLV